MPATLQPRTVTTIGGLEPRPVARAPIAASRTVGSGMMQGPAGKSPYIGDGGTWFAYDDASKTWIDTGVEAKGTPGATGDTGKSPVIGGNGNWFVYDADTEQYIDTETKAQGEDGDDGLDGKDAHSPYVEAGGNWWVFDDVRQVYVDSGVKARGGEGPQGPAGKSPYIGDGGTWFAYDDASKTWIDTGVEAKGPKGDPGTSGNYTTAEQWTGKLWVDGRKIYTKTVNFGVLPNNTTKSVSHGAVAVAQAWIDPMASWCHAEDTGETLNLPFASPGLGAAIEASASATDVRVRTAADLTAFTECYITILYLCTNR